MPNRILREGILTSRRINELSEKEECFFRRLMSIVDDFGRCEAHSALLRASLYPLRLDKVREQIIEDLLIACTRARLLTLYEANGKRYLQVSDFRQQTRSLSKYPPPPDSLCLADDAQKISDAHLGVVVVGGVVEDVVVVGQRKSAPNRPKDVDEVIQYFLEIGSTEDQAHRFFDHFEANGWQQAGRRAIKSWQAAARNWVRRGDDFGGKNLSGSAGPKSPDIPFNPKAPNAHTGGVPVAN